MPSTPQPQPLHRKLLLLYLQQLDVIEAQIAELESMIAEAMKAHEDAIVRLAELPGLGVDSAQQIIAEIGPGAEAFPSAPQLASWVGVCPGRQVSTGESTSNRSAKGNRAMRRLLNQLAHALSAKKTVTCKSCSNASRLVSATGLPGHVAQHIRQLKIHLRQCFLDTLNMPRR